MLVADLLAWLGRWHPVFLHLPIGFFTIVLLLEWYAWRNNKRHLHDTIAWVLLISAASASLTALFGLLLAKEGGYDEPLLTRHKWMGFSFTILSVFLYWAKILTLKQTGTSLWYKSILTLTAIVMVLTGHWGGSLTHGSGFLTEQMPSGLASLLGVDTHQELQKEPTLNQDALIFEEVILPILNNKCSGCHNRDKLRGGLALTSRESILKGGKNGEVVKAGIPLESKMLQRIRLPLDHDDHMPPKSKKQIDEKEEKLLEWWINTGLSFDGKVADYPLTDEIKALLTEPPKWENPVFTISVRKPSEKKIQQLAEAGIHVGKLSNDSPWLEVRLADRNNLDQNTFKKLRPVAKNVIRLDLGNSNFNDELSHSLPYFPHLARLFLDRTEITDATLELFLENEYLEYINLYSTKVSDEGFKKLATLPNLRQIYLWQTEVTDSASLAIAEAHPQLVVDRGVDVTSFFGDVRLPTPIVSSEKDIFKDSILVEINLKLTGTNIHYTLDGTSPDTASPKYFEPLVIEETTILKALASREGWTDSDVVEHHFFRSRYEPNEIKLVNKPHDDYPANGEQSLIDKKRGQNISDGQWLGYQKQHMTVDLDFGRQTEVSQIGVGCFQNTSSWVFFPKGIEVWASRDGKDFQKVMTGNYSIADGPSPPRTKTFTEKFKPVHARFFRVKVVNHMVNPDWHPSAGSPCWLFIDEIFVD